jgi:hypothetical protein
MGDTILGFPHNSENKTKTGRYVRKDMIALNEGNSPRTTNFRSQLHTSNDLAPGKVSPAINGTAV